MLTKAISLKNYTRFREELNITDQVRLHKDDIEDRAKSIITTIKGYHHTAQNPEVKDDASANLLTKASKSSVNIKDHGFRQEKHYKRKKK